MPRLSIALLGPPHIDIDGAAFAVDTRKAVAMLAYLAVSSTSHRRETLAALLWPDYDQFHAMGALRRTLSVLRSALKGDFLEIGRDAVSIDPKADVCVDVAEFQRLINEGHTHGHARDQTCPRCLANLEAALALYRDSFMAGFTLRDSPGFDDWQFFQTENLRRELAEALGRLVQGYASLGDYEKAIGAARRQVALDPLDEPAHRQLMQLYARVGNYNAALRQYQECERVLETELGVSPLEETLQLYLQIKQRRSDSTAEPPLPTLAIETPQAAPAKRMSIAGRETEMRTLQSIYALIQEDGHFLVIEGENGIGKTRLAEEFLAGLRTSGAVTISGRCYSGQANLAYAPVAEGLRAAINEAARPGWQQRLAPLWLGEAAHLLPELKRLGVELSAETPLENQGAQIRFYEGLSQLLLALCGESPPGVIFLDDLQWADEATLDFLTYLVRRLRGRPLLVLVTWCAEEATPGHSLRPLLAEAQRSGLASTLPLERLDRDATHTLVAAAELPGQDAEALSDRLFQESEGLPFILVEYLAALGEGAPLQHDQPWLMPERVRDLLLRRIEKVGEAGWQLLQTAAVIGRSFDFETLHAASGRTDEEAVTTLEELIARRLIQESQPAGEEMEDNKLRSLSYDFVHDKVRSLVAGETSQTRRRLLHQRVAQALVAQARERQDRAGLAAQIAYHFRQGGQAREAAEYYRLAGEHDRSVHANGEALANFQAALALGHPDTAALVEAIADMQVLQGSYAAAYTGYESASAHYQDKDEGLTRLEHKLAELSARMGEWEAAECHFQAAAGILQERGSLPALSRLYSDWSRVSHRQGKVAAAQQLASQALELATQAGDPAATAQAHNVLGILERKQENWTAAFDHLSKSLEIAQEGADGGAQVAALNNLSLAYAEQGKIERAIGCVQQALELCISLGDRHRQAALHNNLADLYHASGQEEAALSHLKQAVVIFAEIGAAGAEHTQAEIWKLTEW